MSENDPTPITLTRTIYDPAIKDFITSTPDAKALPHIKEWITQHNPVIYWYILRIDNQTDTDISQWAVELFTHQALTITEAYIDGSDHSFPLQKERHDPWTEKYVLSIPRQKGIPIVGKGIRRIYFKVDINCKEGLMYEYEISGKFKAPGMESVCIKEKMFQYSCKVGEFRQIFDKDPYEATHYAEKRLSGKYSSNSVHVFTNSFRMIHELSNYCHSGSLIRDELLQKLHLLYASFEKVPEIAGERITPLIHDGIRELDVIVDRDKFAPRVIKLCDSLVELLHMEVMGAEMEGGAGFSSSSTVRDVNVERTEPSIGNAQIMCPSCGNIIYSSNKSLICRECSKRFCTTCEEWFRVERKPGQKPLCEDCFSADQERKKREEEEERLQREKEEQQKIAREEERLRKQKEDEEKAKKQREEQERRRREEDEKLRRQREDEKARKNTESLQRANVERARKERLREITRTGAVKSSPTKIYALALVLGALLVGFLLLAPGSDNTSGTDDIISIATSSNSIGMEFVLIPPGEFKMGSPSGEEDLYSYEGPVHTVTIRKAYYLGKYEVTQAQWREVMGNNPSYFKGDDLPVERVSWNDAQEFVKKLNEMEGTDKYRLPSEAEWEYAARAGTTSRYSFGNDESDLSEYAWYDDNSGGKSHPVGQKKPNSWKLYEMHGNVWEWVQDWWYSNYDGAPTDGSARESRGSSYCVLRGGSWLTSAGYSRSAIRNYHSPGDRHAYLGFRLLQES